MNTRQRIVVSVIVALAVLLLSYLLGGVGAEPVGRGTDQPPATVDLGPLAPA